MQPEIQQGTDAWKQLRLGKVTASRVADVVAKTKTGWGASRANYAAQLITERLTGQVAESYTNAAMQWGTATEPQARKRGSARSARTSSMQWGTATEPQARTAYAFFADCEVAEVGFVNHPVIEMAGCSPDGLVGEHGLVEIKCPNTATHIEFLLGGGIDEKYVKQMQWQMACTRRLFCDFVSFDPRLPADLQLKIERVKRDDILIASLENEVALFLGEIEAKLNRLLTLAA